MKALKAGIVCLVLLGVLIFLKALTGVADYSPFAGTSILIILATLYAGRWCGFFTAITASVLVYAFVLKPELESSFHSFGRFAVNFGEYILEVLLIGVLVDRYIKVNASQKHFRELANAVPVMFWQQDENGDVVFQSHLLTETFGPFWCETIHPDDIPIIHRINQEFIAKQLSFEAVYRLKNIHGDYRHVVAYGVPSFQGSRFIGYVGKILDRTQVHQAQRDLEEANAVKGAILACALDAIVTIDQDGIVLDWNKGAEKTFGYAAEQIVGKEMAGFIIPEESREAFQTAIKNLRDNTSSSRMLGHRVEITALNAEGKKFPVELAICRLVVRGYVRYAGFLRDISDRRFHEGEIKAQSERAEAELRRKEFFFNAISHDLRTPLNSMSLNAQVIQMRRGVCDPDVVEAADSISEGAEAAANLLDKLLDVARATHDKNQIQTVSLDELFTSLQRIFQQRAESKGLLLDFAKNTGVTLKTDPHKFLRVLGNLIDNALKFTAAGRVEVAVKTIGDSVCVSVSDTGMGIKDSDARQLFTEFYQVHNYERDRTKGFGLGLAIARTLVEQIRGTIRLAHSDKSGSRFEVIIGGQTPYGSSNSGGRQTSP